MISKKTIQWMNATALLLFALFIALAGLHLFRRQYNWIEYGIAGIAVALSVIASTARMRLRMEQRRAIKATHASLMKHEWELRHKREW
jgi:hypothetical protein